MIIVEVYESGGYFVHMVRKVTFYGEFYSDIYCDILGCLVTVTEV